MPISVVASVEAFSDEPGFTQYAIKVTVNAGKPIHVHHRFSQFLKLHEALRLSEPFPCAKRWFHPHSAKAQRQAKLNAWLKRVIARYGANTLPPVLIAFLGIPTGSLKLPEVLSSAMASSPVASNSGASQQAQFGKVVSIGNAEEWALAKQESKEKGFPLMVYVSATWCTPSKRIGPKYVELAAKHSGTLCVKVVVDELEARGLGEFSKQIIQECKVSVMPTFVLLSDGKRQGSCHGAKEAELEDMICGGGFV